MPPAEPQLVALEVGQGNILDVEISDAGDVLFLWRLHPDLKARLYNRSGEPLTDAFVVHSEPRAGASGDAAFLKGGGFVVVYEDAEGSSTSLRLDLRMRRYDSSGAPIGGEDELVSDNRSRPSVSALADGGFVAVAQRFESQVGASALHVHRYDADGGRSNGRSSLGVSGAYPKVWATSSGYQLRYFSAERSGPTTMLRYDENDEVLAPPAMLGFPVDGVKRLSDDSLMVLSEGQIRRFSSGGSPLSAWSEVGEVLAPSDLALSGCGQGACVLTVLWGESFRGPLVARMFDTNGRPVESPVSKDDQLFEVAPQIEEPPTPRRGVRTNYGELGAGGGANGELALAWTAWDISEEGNIQTSLEAILITP